MRPPESLLPVARWTLAWLGWLWLGQQGLRAGGAGGLALVALWWGVQALVPAAWVRGPAAAWTLGAAAAVALSALVAADAGRVALWFAALAWGAACARVRAVRACRQEGVASRWSPAAGAVLAGVVVLGPAPAGLNGLAVAAVLAGCALVLRAQAHGQPARRPAGPVDALSSTAMGLMMGSAWVSADLCRVAGWSPTAVVAGHVLAMGLAPALVGERLRALGAAPRLCLLGAGGAWALLDPTPAGWVLAMALQAAAWAAGAVPGVAVQAVPSTRASSLAMAAAGPLSLLAVGVALTGGSGPQSLAWAHAALGAVALGLLWRRSGQQAQVGAAG